MKWLLTTGRARIMAPPALVWQWVAEPRGWSAWNPKIEEIVPFAADAPREGWRFRIAYRLRKKKQLAAGRTPVIYCLSGNGGRKMPKGQISDKIIRVT